MHADWSPRPHPLHWQRPQRACKHADLYATSLPPLRWQWPQHVCRHADLCTTSPPSHIDDDHSVYAGTPTYALPLYPSCVDDHHSTCTLHHHSLVPHHTHPPDNANVSVMSLISPSPPSHTGHYPAREWQRWQWQPLQRDNNQHNPTSLTTAQRPRL